MAKKCMEIFFQEYLNKNEIIGQTTSLDTPPQNGIAKIKIDTQ